MDNKLTGCGHGHRTHAEEDCGCGHDHGHRDGGGPNYNNGLSIAENNVLMGLMEREKLPVARFALTASKAHHAYAVALEPVYIADPGDSLEQVKAYGALFAGMEDKGLISIEYDAPLDGYAYAEYRQSSAYGTLPRRPPRRRRAASRSDTPVLELGRMILTGKGRAVIDRMLA